MFYKKILIIISLLTIFLNAKHFNDEFYAIKDVKKKKAAFISNLLPLIENAEKQILKEQKLTENFFYKTMKDPSLLSKDDFKNILKISKKYKIKNLYMKEEYIKKIDLIPKSLVISQAAIESAWGNSRFMKLANNMFGQWTFGKKGLMPTKRDENKTHKIKIFKNLQSSVNAYMTNLNRNRAYRVFRNVRYNHKINNKFFNGISASDTMHNYSGIGKNYNKILKSIIKENKLLRYDKQNLNKKFNLLN